MYSLRLLVLPSALLLPLTFSFAQSAPTNEEILAALETVSMELSQARSAWSAMSQALGRAQVEQVRISTELENTQEEQKSISGKLEDIQTTSLPDLIGRMQLFMGSFDDFARRMRTQIVIAYTVSGVSLAVAVTAVVIAATSP